MSDHNQDTPERVSRIVDVKIPLWGLLCSLGTAAFFIVSMWFTTNQTAAEVRDLKIDVKAGNSQVTTLAGEQALLRFRMENLEGELRLVKNAMPGAGTNNPMPNGRRQQ